MVFFPQKYNVQREILYELEYYANARKSSESVVWFSYK